MQVFIKGLNVCPHRRQNLLHHQILIEAAKHQIVKNADSADVILIWTCGFRKDVVDNSIRELKRIRNHYRADIVAMGCLPDIDFDKLRHEFDGLIVPWKQEKEFFRRYFQISQNQYEKLEPVYYQAPICKNAAEYRRSNPDKDATFADQFFKLMICRGCPYNCSYCTEKLAFPEFHSMPVDELIEACIKNASDDNQFPVILIGDCLGQYGRDCNSTFPKLLIELKKNSENLIFALQNLHPKDFLTFRKDFQFFLSENWIAHINLPIQSGSDKILSTMERQYKCKDLESIINIFDKNGFKQFDTHLIVGFPGETDGDFLETINLIKNIKPKYALVSKYYDAPGTKASRKSAKIPEVTMNERLLELERVMKEMGMIYNIDGNQLMKERINRINRRKEENYL